MRPCTLQQARDKAKDIAHHYGLVLRRKKGEQCAYGLRSPHLRCEKDPGSPCTSDTDMGYYIEGVPPQMDQGQLQEILNGTKWKVSIISGAHTWRKGTSLLEAPWPRSCPCY